MDTKDILDRFRNLALPQKLELLELLWDDLASDPEQIPVSDAQRALLDERVFIAFHLKWTVQQNLIHCFET